MEVEPSSDASTSTFDAFFRANYANMTSYARARLRDDSSAEELVQEAFVRLVTLWDKVLSATHPRAYAYAVLRNNISDHFRRSRRSPTRSLDATEEGPSGDGGIGDAELSVVILDLLDQLPSRQREVVYLRFVGDLTNREIAELLGLSERTVAVHLHRSLKALRVMLSADEAR
ncbi:RNA polymerase sigma factor [Streptomyces anthocyanicus]|uniref:RNA polymerase sigma factor n=1 Tax=Streptomyces anthocyanicus TaxID=68174 RepID=UPI0036A4E7B6